MAEITTHQAWHLGLGQAHARGGGLVGQAQGGDGFANFDYQAGFDVRLVGFRRPQIGVYVGRTPRTQT